MEVKIIQALISLGYRPTVNVLQILDWIEEAYGVVIEIQYYPSDTYGFSITKKGEETFSDDITNYTSRLEALNGALKLFLSKFEPHIDR